MSTSTRLIVQKILHAIGPLQKETFWGNNAFHNACIDLQTLSSEIFIGAYGLHNLN